MIRMNWFYAIQNEQRGPVSEAEVGELQRTGVIQPATLVWREGLAQWQTFASLQPPPPLNGLVCAQCGRVFAPEEIVQFGDAAVCAGCKPLFLQRLREGVVLAAPGALRYAGFWVRFGAIFVDGIIGWSVSIGISLACGQSFLEATGFDNNPEMTQLDWLADERRGHGRAEDGRLQHYRYRFVRKQGGKTRLIEAPKSRLKAIQRRILREILSVVPPHRCVNGFVAGRSCLTGAQVHAGEAVVATFDLSQFFPSIGLARVHGLFRCLGYPWAVARRLAGLCTTITPNSVFRRLPNAEQADWQVQMVYRAPHLPQGAPTSPMLANLLAWTLDRRLHGLARAMEANYTRYADDLAFSGDTRFADGLGRFGKAVEAIVQEEGFLLNAAKTRVMPRTTAQRVTGIVVNEHCNVGRAEFDALKAVLHNCARTDPASQNRAMVADFRAHLGGRVSWVEQINPPRGAKLRRLYDLIDWTASSSGPGSFSAEDGNTARPRQGP